VRTIAAVLLSLMPLFAAAQINKCIDASGKVVGYASECPAGTRPEQTGIRNAPGEAPGQKSLSERDADFRKRQLEQKESSAKAEKKAAEAEQRKDACNTSQAYLKALQGGQRIRKTDPKTGESAYLADSDYPSEIAAAERAVAANCK
jgi:hypothetical protein